MSWYDVFANFYDASLDDTYRVHREQARDALQLAHGMTVVDVGCGTGASFPMLVDGVGPNGRVVGADASAGMLQKARSRVRRNGWHNVELLEVRAEDSREQQRIVTELRRVDRVLCFLSLSVIDNWQLVFDQWFSALAPGGRFVIADVHNQHPGVYARLVELVSRATLSRSSWEPLHERSAGFDLAWQASSWVLGGQFFVASGSRT